MQNRRRRRGFEHAGTLPLNSLGLPRGRARDLILAQAWEEVAGSKLVHHARALCVQRGEGTAPPVDVAVQLSVIGSYRPPVFVSTDPAATVPPQTIISVPVHTVVAPTRADGTPAPVEVAVQLFDAGS